MNFLKGALQFELDSFFTALQGSDRPVREVTKSAFCQARQKLRYEAFIELNDIALSRFYAEAPFHHWHGRRLLAGDGSSLRLPDTADVRKEFSGAADEVPQARILELYDVLNRLVVAATCAPTYMGEGFLAEQLLPYAKPGDLLLFDRGFPSFYLMALHRHLGLDFCMRVATSRFTATTAFAAGTEIQQWVTLSPSNHARSTCQRDGIPALPLRVRLIRVPLPSGETEILITSLGDDFPASLFPDLYHLRWGIEEAYKAQKCRLELENFSGRSANAVLQDFHASLFAANLASMLRFAAQQHVDEKTASRQHRYRVNYAAALSKTKHFLARLFYALDELQQRIGQWITWIAADAEPLRPDRSAPRKKRLRPDRFRGTHKRCS